jgi:hypothetical protein
MLVRSYRTFSPLPMGQGPIGGLFSVALSFGSPRLAVSQHPALWSPDLPQPDNRAATTRPAHRGPFYQPARRRRTGDSRPRWDHSDQPD